MTTSLFAFVVVLGVLIFFHELGHFLVARLFGVGVERFSLGFGPRIAGARIGITDYRLSAIPLGGYVKMVGEEPGAELDPAQVPLSFTHKPVLQRICIVAAGPAFNLLLAVLIFFVIFLISGAYVLKPRIGEVSPGSPASQAGLQSGDLIRTIEGRSVDSWEDMAEAITASKGRPLSMTLQRNDRVLQLEITPELRSATNIFGEKIDRYIIGITSAGDGEQRPMGVVEAVGESFYQTYRITELTIVSIVKLITGALSTKTLGGPIMIAQMAGDQARAGAANLIFFIAIISINLAILNILPIPVLDGGHLLFFIIEGIKGSPVSTRVREVAQQIGIFLLLMLMIFVFYNDITRILFS